MVVHFKQQLLKVDHQDLME